MRAEMDQGANPSVPIEVLREREEKAEAKRMLWKKQEILEGYAKAKAVGEDL